MNIFSQDSKLFLPKACPELDTKHEKWTSLWFKALSLYLTPWCCPVSTSSDSGCSSTINLICSFPKFLHTCLFNDF